MLNKDKMIGKSYCYHNNWSIYRFLDHMLPAWHDAKWHALHSASVNDCQRSDGRAIETGRVKSQIKTRGSCLV